MRQQRPLYEPLSKSKLTNYVLKITSLFCLGLEQPKIIKDKKRSKSSMIKGWMGLEVNE